MKSIPQDARRVNSSISIPAIPHDEICAGCWNYGDSFVIEYPFDDWTPVYLCCDCKTRSTDYRQRDLIIRNAGRFMGAWDWRGSVEVGR